jgi:hypothetical protein
MVDTFIVFVGFAWAAASAQQQFLGAEVQPWGVCASTLPGIS